jgi:hypothetical protein
MAKTTFTVRGSNGREYLAQAVVPDRTPRPGTSHQYRTLKGEFQARYLSRGGYNSSVGSARKLETAVNHWSAYMMKREGLASGDNMKKAHVDRFVQHLKSGKSLLSGKELTDKAIKDVLSGVRKILYCYGKEHMLKGTYESMGLRVSHRDLERPVKFTEDYPERRAVFQERLEGHRTTWMPVASQLGQAFGLRLAERLASRDLIEYKDGKLMATNKLGKYKEVTERQLQARYGRTIIDRLHVLRHSPGVPHLIVEDAKGDRNRFQPVNTDVRLAAVERLHDHIRSRDDNKVHMKIHPDRQSTKSAHDAYEKTMERYGAGRETQLNAHGDRHWQAQQLYHGLRAEGLSHKAAARVVVEELGHDDPRKINYYVDTGGA